MKNIKSTVIIGKYIPLNDSEIMKLYFIKTIFFHTKKSQTSFNDLILFFTCHRASILCSFKFYASVKLKTTKIFLLKQK